MNIVDRVKKICLTPNTEWQVIAEETTPAGNLISGYVLPLAAIGAVAGFIGGSLIGFTVPFVGSYRVPLFAGAISAVLAIVLAVVGVFILSLIISALAPTFGAQKNTSQALKVAAYSYTPAWLAGVFQIFPIMGVLALVGAIYGLYLLYLGLPRVMKCSQDKAVGYTAVVVVCAIVVGMFAALITGAVVGVGALGTGMLSGIIGGNSAADVQFDADSPLGGLQELGEKLEESARNMEAAERSGDSEAQVAAAMESLGTLLGGGNRVEAIDIEQLKTFVPDTFAGLPKTGNSAERTGIAGLMVAKAEATYGDGAQTQVALEVMDSGGASGLMGLASWVNVEGEREDASGSERTQKIDGRLVHERASKVGGDNEFAVVIGDRFMVSARSRAVDLNALKSAVSDLDLARLESMKSIGVQQ